MCIGIILGVVVDSVKGMRGAAVVVFGLLHVGVVKGCRGAAVGIVIIGIVIVIGIGIAIGVVLPRV